MNLTLLREDFTGQSTIGRLYVDNKQQCCTLEDVCREIVPGTWTPNLKVFGKTAIPYGKYGVVLSYSQRFGVIMPQIIEVPDYEGIRIHWGNRAIDTDGCILVGESRGTDEVLHSRSAFGALFRILDDASRREKIWIEVTK